MSSSATWCPGFRPLLPAHDPRNYEPTELYDTNQRGNAGALALFLLGVVRTGTTGWRSGSLRPPAAEPARCCLYRLFLGLHPLFRLRGRHLRDSEIVCLRHFWSQDEQRYPRRSQPASSQGREPGISCSPRVRGNRRTVQMVRFCGYRAWRRRFRAGGRLHLLLLTDITDSEDDYQGAEETTGAVAVGGSVTPGTSRWTTTSTRSGSGWKPTRATGYACAAPSPGAEPWPTRMCLSVTQLLQRTQTELRLWHPDYCTTTIKSEIGKGQRTGGQLSIPQTHDYLDLGGNAQAPGTGTYTIEVEEATTSMGQRANSPATGGPGITGTVQAGETLTATTAGIEDEDGLTGAVFAYQWVRSDTDIEGAASSTYTVTGADEGKPIQVRVTFTDDAGNAESLTSYAKLSAPPLIIPD